MKNLLNNLSIKTKIIGSAFLLLTLILLNSAYALYAMNQIGNELETIAEQDIPLTTNITAITEHQLEQSVHFERALRFGFLLQQEGDAKISLEAEIDLFDKLSKKVGEEIHEGEVLAEAAITKAHRAGDAKEFEHVVQLLKIIEKTHTDFEQHAHQVFTMLKNGEVRDANELINKVVHEEEQLIKVLETLLAEIETFTAEAARRAAEHEHTAIKQQGALAFLSLVIGVFFSALISNNIVKRLEVTVDDLDALASKDLTRKIIVDGRDEIGKLQRSTQTMSSHLQKTISQISATTAQLATTAEEVSVVTTQAGVNIQQQQLETEQVATAMNEMSATVGEVAMNVGNTSSAANAANTETEKGRTVVEETVQGIQQLAEQLEKTADVITQVEQDSENINAVLEVIKSIAEQTNLLALNAAIEAARAGEQGRGFAVVADEVRTLAGRTQESTEEVNAIIEKLQAGSQNAVQAMSQSREQAKSVVDQANLAGTSLTTIAESVSQIDQMCSQIATAAEEQSSVVEEMNRNIVRISDMATQNASGSLQASEAGKDFARMAIELQGLVEEFEV